LAKKILLICGLFFPLITLHGQQNVDRDKFKSLSNEIAKIVKDNKAVGVSVAIIDNYEVAWAKGFGIASVNSDDSITTETLFQVASITKSFVATAVMQKVQEGSISLTGDVNTQLISWHLPQNDFTKSSPVTVKQLLSHTAGVSNSMFPGFDPNYVLPTIVQVLDGLPPAKNERVKIIANPGSRYSYSNCGYWILAQLLEDIANKELGGIIEEGIFQPLQMAHSTFERHLPNQKFTSIAFGHLSGNRPMEQKYLTYQPLSAGGLWSTPTDLAKFLIEMQLSIKGESKKIIDRDNAKLMLTPVMNNYGLGFTNEIRGTGVKFFGHGGHNIGYKSIMLASMNDGFGVVILANSEDGSKAGDKILKLIGRKLWGF
jgi:CubicO group peptidase (beta-lactamase class C family)